MANRVTVLPASVRLPDGRVLAFSPARRCPCADCRATFQAWDAGTLELPSEVLV